MLHLNTFPIRAGGQGSESGNRLSAGIASLFIVISLIAAGCAGRDAATAKNTIKAKPASRSPEQIRSISSARYPDELYITAWGSSADGYEEAEVEASADVSNRVSSTIRTETAASSGSVEFGQDEQLRREYTKLTEISSEFEHGELISIDEESCYSRDGLFFTMAFLEKEALGNVLAEEYGKSASLFSRAYGSCILALQHGNFDLYSRGIGDATRFGRELMSLNSRIRAVSGMDHPLHAHYLDQYLNLLSTVIAVKSDICIKFKIGGPHDRKAGELLSSIIIDILHDLGYDADMKRDEECDSDFQYNLTAWIWQGDSQAHLGYISRAEIRFDLQACSDNRFIWGFIKNPPPGVSTRSAEAASEELLHRIADPAFIGDLRETIARKLEAAFDLGLQQDPDPRQNRIDG